MHPNPKQQRSLYLGDLSFFCQESDVLNAFQVFGEIQEVRLMRSKQDGKCLGYGFITFMTVEQAHNALEAMDGKVFIGRQLNVSWAYKRNKQEIKEHKLIAQINNNHELPQGAELHFSFVSKQTDFLVTEATLRAIFEEFGPIQHICIKKTAFNERGGQNGYGFVHYPLTPDGISAAIQASSVICQIVLDRVIYDCMMTHAFQKYLMQAHPNSRSAVFSSFEFDGLKSNHSVSSDLSLGKPSAESSPVLGPLRELPPDFHFHHSPSAPPAAIESHTASSSPSTSYYSLFY